MVKTVKDAKLCKILAEAAQHDNAIVTLEGVYLRLPHGAILTAPDCTLSPRPTVVLLAGRGGYRPSRRGLYSHLLRYWRWGLLERNVESKGLLYRIPARGSGLRGSENRGVGENWAEVSGPCFIARRHSGFKAVAIGARVFG